MKAASMLERGVLRLDGGTQPRAELNHDTVTEYAETMAAGVTFPPVVVFYDGSDYWLADGFHRERAAAANGFDEIDADVRQGTRRDAVLFAAGANADHGLRRTSADKRRSVLMLLNDPEWREWSNREIARRCGVSLDLVNRMSATIPERIVQIERTVERNGARHTQLLPMARQEAPAEADAKQEGWAEERRYTERQATMYRQVASQKDGDRTDMYVYEGDRELPAIAGKTFNRTNMNVDWAWWTWNPVTGCLHDCPYCYARDIANRFYPTKFAPTFHPERLTAPANTRVPQSDDPRSRRVFTCSMADLFGNWVPQEWIDAVFEQVRDSPQWEFLFLTKFPQRLASIEWPDNAWVGTTVDRQYRVAIAEKAFRGVKAGVKWLSCEPMLEPLKFSSLEMFDWVVIGGQSASSQEPAFQPPWEWIEDLLAQARAAGCRVYFKDNLHNRPQEQPRSVVASRAG